MASLKILDRCTVSPPPSSAVNNHPPLPLTFFDLMWLRFPPVELLFFYSLPDLQTSHFFNSVLPKLKNSLSLTLHHFLPLSGRLLWPSHSSTPFIQYTPGDAVTLIVALSDSNFNLLSQNSPRDSSLSRPLIPHLDSSASLISLQITLFPNSGFCIGISTHHAVLDGKSSSMFIKAWSHLSKTQNPQKSSSLLPEFEPFFNGEAIITPYSDLHTSYKNEWTKNSHNHPNPRSLKILSDAYQPTLDGSSRATFELTREDLEKLKKRVSQKLDDDHDHDHENHKTTLISSYVVTVAYVSVCFGKAMEKYSSTTKKFRFGFSVDCRAARLEPPVPENYFGNCVMIHLVEEFDKEDGVVVIAKKIQRAIREVLEGKKSVLDGADTLFARLYSLNHEGVHAVGVTWSNRFGVYGVDFGWGRPKKVEITSVDRGNYLAIGMTESRDGSGGIEVSLVLNQHVMDCFNSVFHQEMESL